MLYSLQKNIFLIQATREDVGSYQCYLFAGTTSNFVQHVTQVSHVLPGSTVDRVSG